MSEEGVSRRSILRGAAVAAVAGVAGYSVAASSDAAGTPAAATAANASGGGEAGTRLASLADIPAGGGVIIDSPAVVISRSPTGKVRAFSSVCTHQGCPVNSIEGDVVLCPCHDSRFDLASGEAVSGPARQPLTPVAVEVRGDELFAV